MPDRLNQTKEAVEAAKANGWVFVPETGSLRRSVEHQTPESIKSYGWWPGETYNSYEFMSFIFTDRNRVPKVIYKVMRCPWIDRSDTSISFKRALELLAQPVAQSEVHDH